jgi:DNA repair exonuclease SbcCD ATPase subunit
MTADNGTADTGDGFIVGTDPKQPPIDPATLTDQALSEVEQSRTVRIVDENTGAPLYTEDDVARIRQEEKAKLYNRIEAQGSQISEFQTQMQALQEERDARATAEQEARDEAERLRKAEEEANLNAKELIERRDQEWSQRFEEMEGRMETERAVYEQERRYAELMEYKHNVLAQNEGRIVPQLLDLVTGSTPEEIDQSVQDLIAKSDAIFEEYREAAQGQRSAMRGTAATAPPVGPMENESSYQPMSVADISNIPMSEWPKYRQQLLSQSGQNRFGG